MNNKRGILFAILTALMLAVMVPSIMPGKNNASSVEAKKARISNGRITLRKGSTFKLSIRHRKKKVHWHTSNAKIATVSRGKVTAKGLGRCTVWAQHGKRRLTCAVTVRDFNFSVSSKSLKLNKNESQTIIVYSERGSALTVGPPTDKNGKPYDPHPTIARVSRITGPGKKTAITFTAGNSAGKESFVITEKKTKKTILVTVTVSGINYFGIFDDNNKFSDRDLYLELKEKESKEVFIRCDDINGFTPSSYGDIIFARGKWNGTQISLTIKGECEGEGTIILTENKNNGKELKIHVTVNPNDAIPDDNTEEG